MTSDVAVIVPCYNHGAYLDEALASVHAQTRRPAELVVVDDGSTDELTLRVLSEQRRAGVRVISQGNRGLAGARNTGVRATLSPYFVPLDADDRLHPEFLARLRPRLERDARIGYVYCHARLFGARSGRWRCPPFERGRLLLHNLSTATAVVRRTAFDAVGGYAEDMTSGFEDWDFWLALCRAGYRGLCVPRALFDYRQHPAGRSMRARVEQAPEPMLRRMIAHHRDLYVRLLNLPTAAPVEEILAERAAACDLDELRRARLWQLLRIFGGATADLHSAAAPSRQLALARATCAYRRLRRLKRTPLLRLSARVRHGRARPA